MKTFLNEESVERFILTHPKGGNILLLEKDNKIYSFDYIADSTYGNLILFTSINLSNKDDLLEIWYNDTESNWLQHLCKDVYSRIPLTIEDKVDDKRLKELIRMGVFTRDKSGSMIFKGTSFTLELIVFIFMLTFFFIIALMFIIPIVLHLNF